MSPSLESAVPASFGGLSKQRFRWAFGTLQCLWKHRRILRERHPAGLALVGIPQAWLFQIVFAVISPLIDLALAVSIASTAIQVAQHGWAQTETDVLRMLAEDRIDFSASPFERRLNVWVKGKGTGRNRANPWEDDPEMISMQREQTVR